AGERRGVVGTRQPREQTHLEGIGTVAEAARAHVAGEASQVVTNLLSENGDRPAMGVGRRSRQQPGIDGLAGAACGLGRAHQQRRLAWHPGLLPCGAIAFEVLHNGLQGLRIVYEVVVDDDVAELVRAYAQNRVGLISRADDDTARPGAGAMLEMA